ncbi:MAG: hypothetical protein ABGZ17_09875 [Planctomycetaceae bacterium]
MNLNPSLTLLIAAVLVQSGCCGVRSVPGCAATCRPGFGFAWPVITWRYDCEPDGCRPRRWQSALTPDWCDDCVTHHLARRAARRQLRHSGEHSRDFKAGFVQSFEDLADGAPGVVPAVPPKKYWTAYYRTPEGQQSAHSWFDGYRAGMDAAGCDGSRGGNRVASSMDTLVQNQGALAVAPDSAQFWSSGPLEPLQNSPGSGFGRPLPDPPAPSSAAPAPNQRVPHSIPPAPAPTDAAMNTDRSWGPWSTAGVRRAGATSIDTRSGVAQPARGGFVPAMANPSADRLQPATSPYQSYRESPLNRFVK